ncbi:hypothetical protein GCM10023065_30540 [Microbacterium laevaniformans]
MAATLRAQGAVPVIAPLINFAPSTDQATLEQALADLAAGAFDWVTLTSATTVDVLYAYRAVIPASTRVAAVGETTAAALAAVGYRVDLVPDEDNSAAGMASQLIELEPAPRRILTLRSEIAKPVLTRPPHRGGARRAQRRRLPHGGCAGHRADRPRRREWPYQRDPRHQRLGRRTGTAAVPGDPRRHRDRRQSDRAPRRTPARWVSA